MSDFLPGLPQVALPRVAWLGGRAVFSAGILTDLGLAGGAHRVMGHDETGLIAPGLSLILREGDGSA